MSPSTPTRFFLIGALCAAACRAPGPTLEPSHATALRDSVATALTAFQRYSAASQWDSLGALYSSDTAFRFLESGTIQYRTAAEVRNALEAIPSGTHLETTYEDLVIVPLAPGLAHVTSRFQTAFVGSTGTQFTFVGVLSMIWLHEA
jgi:hypothetical protein